MAGTDSKLFAEEDLDVGVSARDLALEAQLQLAREIARRSAAEQGLPEVSESPWPR